MGLQRPAPFLVYIHRGKVYTEEEKDGLRGFLDAVYDAGSGVAYVALKKFVNEKAIFEQSFFEWPAQADTMVSTILDKRLQGDVYYAPALFSSKSASKEAGKGASVAWVEIDSVPRNTEGILQPDIRVQSSKEGKEHWYWRLNSILEPSKLEKINKSLTYLLGADKSGWDSVQILRPPYTYNYKYGAPLPVSTLALGQGRHGLDAFDWLPEPPEPAVAVPIKLESLPELEDLIFSYTLKPEIFKLFKEGPADKEHGKSEALMYLGHCLVEAGFTNEATMAMLLHADKRWGKFHKRDDCVKRLLEIVSIARNKYDTYRPVGLQLMSFKDIISMERELEWLVEDLLEENGNAMLAAAPGLGKTQFTLQVAAHIALGKDIFGHHVTKPSKVVFFSLEMDDLALKKFLSKQALSFTSDELDLLHENFVIYPLGRPMALNKEAAQKEALEIIDKVGAQGAFFDSLSRSTDAALTDDVAMRNLMGWVDGFRAEFKKFTWWIHHNRKPSGDNKRPRSLEDIYGSVFVTSPLSTGMILWRTPTKHELELITVKSRLAEEPDPYIIVRDPKTLTFSRKEGIIKVIDKQQEFVSGLPKTSSRIKGFI